MPVSVPFTKVVNSHGLLIQVAGGQLVGAITSFSTRQSRAAKPLFEFGTSTIGGGDDVEANSGEPFEIAPGVSAGTTIDIQRYDIWTSHFEQAFGTQDLTMLTNQLSSIRFIEFWTGPEANLNFTKVYYGAWFTSLGRTINAEGDRVRMATAQAMYARIRNL